MSEAGNELTGWQTFALQAFIPIVLIGVILPIGFPVFVLGLDGAPFEDALSHGELFLAAGNMAFTSSVVALAMRPDRAVTVSIINSFVWAVVVMPSYYGWVHIATSRSGGPEGTEATIGWGSVCFGAGLIATVALIGYAFVRPASVRAVASEQSATLRG